MKKQQGFTLIELIMVIVILGILAATALPKFVDLSGEAEQAALEGVAGSASSAMSINYASCAAVNNDATNAKCTAVDNCNDVGGLMQGGLPSGYTVTAAALASNGATANCAINKTGYTASPAVTFSGIGAGQ